MSRLLYVVGIGPGFKEGMTFEADQALKDSEVIVGYGLYVNLVKSEYPHAEYKTTGMRKETERCRMALESAQSGRTTAMICSGDSGVYGMAGLIYQLAAGDADGGETKTGDQKTGDQKTGDQKTKDQKTGDQKAEEQSPEKQDEDFRDVEIRVVPGVSALLSGGARLGSPLGHDFCVISLSDLLTPKERIEKRLRAAADGDFCVCIYNPSSHGRPDYLAKACAILMEGKSPDTVCGYVRNIGREGEESGVMTLAEMKDFQADMLTTVFIGNSNTKIIDGKMVTPRGYRL